MFNFSIIRGKLLLTGVFSLLALLLAFFGCDMSVSLGDMVNTEKPKIGTGDGEDNAPGAFLQSRDHVHTDLCPADCDVKKSNIIELTVEQPFGLDEVFMTVTYRKKVYDPVAGFDVVRTFTDKIPAWQDPQTQLWYVELPTGDWEDGKITTTVTAIDVSKNTVTTTDMIYYIKNTFPQIELSIPRIKESEFDNESYLENLVINPLFTGDSIMGIASDAKGIAPGYPKIMIWPAQNNTYYNDTLGAVTYDENGFPLAHEYWGHWKTVVNSNWNPVSLESDSLSDAYTAVQFRWPLVNLLPGGELPPSDPLPEALVPGDYNIAIKIRDSFEEPHFNENTYPNRAENPNYPAQDNPVKFITIRVSSSLNPVLNIRDIPQYYNPDTNFSGKLVIQRGGTVVHRYAIIAESESLALNNLNHPELNYSQYITGDSNTGLFSINIPSADVIKMIGDNKNGDKLLLVKVVDMEGESYTASVNVIFDNIKPSMNFIQPRGMGDGSLSPVTSTVAVRGSAVDNQLADRMFYALGVTEVNYVKNLSQEARESRTEHTGWVDTQMNLNHNVPCPVGCEIEHAHITSCPPTCTDHSPRKNHPNHLNNSNFMTVDAQWDFASILQSWLWTFADIVDFCIGASGLNGNYYVSSFEQTNENNQWNLPIMFKIIDKAGNVGIIDANLVLDPDGDLPIVTVSAPNNNATVGGQVRVNGIAVDNEWIHSMEIRVAKVNNGIKNYVVGGADSWKIIRDSESACLCCTDFDPNGSMSTAGSAVNWFYTLNSGNQGDIDYLTPSPGTIQEVLVEVRARDSYVSTPLERKEKPGNPVPLTLFFDPGMPTISDPLIIHGNYTDWNSSSDKTLMEEAYAIGSNKVAGKITLKVEIEDDTDMESIRINMSGSWSELFNSRTPNNNNPFIVHNTPGAEQHNKYTLFIPIDTNTINNGAYGYGPNGTPNNFTLAIDAQEKTDTKLKQNSTVSFQIDNFYPMGNFNGLLTAVGSYDIHGKAWDSAVNKTRVGGVERVVVYFSRPANAADTTGTPISLDGIANPGGNHFTQHRPLARTGRIGTEPNPTTGEQGPIISEGNAPSQLLFFPNVRTFDIASNSYKYVSNNNGIVIDSDGRGSGGNSTGFSGGSVITWTVVFDSTRLASGPYILNYVVFDQAQNATHYSQRIFIANNRPEITRITLGTDNNNDGYVDVTRGELTPYPADSRDAVGYNEITPDFRVQNKRFQLAIDTKEGSGNGVKRYEVYYVTRNAVKASSLTAGNVYTIAAQGDVEWFNYGSPEYYAQKAFYKGVTFTATNAYASLPANVEVYGYTKTGGSATSQTGNFSANSGSSTNEIRFGEAGTGFNTTVTAGAFDTIVDSTGVDIEDGKIVWDKTDPRYFIVHVYDTTVTGANMDQQLSHVALLNIGVTNGDTINPEIEIAQIGYHHVTRESTIESQTFRENYAHRDAAALSEAEYNENIITNAAGNRKGYVQYREHNGIRADISGMVIFKGKAMDNSNIASIAVNIGGTPLGGVLNNSISTGVTGVTGGNLINIASWSANGLVPANPANTIDAMKSDSSTNTWGFKTSIFNGEHPEQFITSDFGHVLNWSFAWDSSSYTNLVGTNVPVTFIITDSAGLITRTAIYVNIVPYISEIKTTLSGAFSAQPDAFNRSAHGWYPVSANDKIEINGFNLGRTAGEGGALTSTISIAGANVLTANVVTNNKRSIGVRIDSNGAFADTVFDNTNAIVSGPVVVTVNGIASINNDNNPNAHYNKEPNNLNNNLLTDDRNLYVWSVGSLLNKPGTGIGTGVITLESPSFRVSPTGRRLLAYANYPSQPGFIVLNNNSVSVDAIGEAIETTVNRYAFVTAAVDSNVGTSFNNQHWYIGGTSQTSNNCTYYNLYTRRYTTNDVTNANAANNQALGDYKSRVSANRKAAADGNDSNRIRIPRIHSRSTGNDTSAIVISYGDSLTNDDIILHYGTVSGANAAIPQFAGDLNNTKSGTAAGTTPSNTAVVQKVTDSSQPVSIFPYRGSIYTASASLSTDIPVIAWYDNNSMNLLISYGNAVSAANATTAQWQERAVVVHSGAGSHVDMAVDAANNIHLAYYHALNGGLYYAYIPYNSSVAAQISKPNITTVKVDTYLSAGTKIMINVREQGLNNFVPYISYMHGSFTDTRYSVRVAWPVAANTLQGTDNNDFFTGNWEAMTVPVENVPLVTSSYNELIIANGVPQTSADWISPSAGSNYLSAAGYTDGDSGANMHKTILVSYMTATRYEGAVLKYDIAP